MTGPPQEPNNDRPQPLTRDFLLIAFRPVGIKIAAAFAVAVVMSFATDRSLAQSLRIAAAICLLVSFVLAGKTFASAQPSGEALSGWDQALIFSLVAGAAHILARMLS